LNPEYAMSIINHLPTSEVCEIVRRLRPRLYIDFFQYLPPEVCLKILGFLDPISLINTAKASREWMLLALDRKLWEQLYILEGFRVIRSEVHKFEEELNVDHSRPSELGQSGKRRAITLPPTLEVDDDSEMPDADTPAISHGSIFGPSKQVKLDVDENMTDLSNIPSFSNSKSATFPGRSSKAALQDRTNRRLSAASVLPKNVSPLSHISSLVVLDRGDNKKKLNWQYLYSQRRRLEANWEAEKYTNFQLPHPAHPEEAHAECIYTIQHSGKYLVSGSRDKTLRIWDLDTRRLVRDPLRAHTGSVLCLQFDADPEEDLIVSGSSDATVVLWKFSTGQVIQRLRKAHRESVLNVRFDKRVLVTCSKDKTIKIFNRRPLNPGELGYPVLPGSTVHPSPMYLTGGVNPVPTYLNNYGYNPAPSAGLTVKPAYTMIGCLEGHGAAVNAVQIHGEEVVSASGDRTVKVWNWPEQTCTRTLIGHTKGIACVQYDGRRIVSGSSDNEVKVFDAGSGLEVASLRAHTNLVRTVQAGFGDLPYSEEEDKEDAKMTDFEYFKAVDSGTINRATLLQRGRPRNAGSRKPEDITAYGAKLPPGGGGGRFGRIVSGSYDETIIIWRRDKEGVWRAQHTLRQEDAAHIASRAALRSSPIALASQSSQSTNTQSAPAPAQQQAPSTHTASTSNTDAPTVPFAPGSLGFYQHIINISVHGGPVALRQAIQAHPQILSHSHLRQTIAAWPEPARRQAMNAEVDAALQSMPGGTTNSSSSLSSQLHANQASASTSTQPVTQTPAQPQVTHGPIVQTPLETAVVATNVTAAPVAPAPHQPVQAHHHLPVNMARVFKLQFDARRIICCSQTSVIVGWDFANGDEQIIEASRFFAPIE